MIAARGALDEVLVIVDPALGLWEVGGHVAGPRGENKRSLWTLSRGQRREVTGERDERDAAVLLNEVLAVGVGVEDQRLLAASGQDGRDGARGSFFPRRPRSAGSAAPRRRPDANGLLHRGRGTPQEAVQRHSRTGHMRPQARRTRHRGHTRPPSPRAPGTPPSGSQSLPARSTVACNPPPPSQSRCARASTGTCHPANPRWW